MKRILFFVALVLGVVSCQSDLDDFGANVGGEQEVIVNVSLPEETRANSAEGGISNVIASDEYTVRYIFKVYNAKGDQWKAPVTQYSDNKSVSFPVRLVPNRDYRFVVWADIVKESDKADLHYNTANFPEISLNGTWVAMDETRDAYTVSEVVKEFNSAKSISLTLKRPLAKLRVITTDMEELLGLTPQTATVSYVTEHYNTFNAFKSEVGDSKVGGCKHENYAIKEYETTNGKVLFTDYFFAKDEVVKFNISVAMSDGKSVDRSFTTDIPVKRNHLTTLIGDILTDGNNITVNVEEGFENGTEWNPKDDKYDVAIWDGKSVTEPDKDSEGNYIIKLPSELAWLADQVNGVTRAAADSFSGKTFKLTQDIDLGSNEWTPIGNSTNKFQGTFDGQGHKIANLLITGNNSYVGLFGFTTNGEIKNLVVENAKVSGYVGVGVVAGSPYTSKFNDITVQGHVEVNGFSYVGGVGGRNAYANWNNITVNVDETSYVNANSVEDGTAYRTYVGGVCGFNGEGGHSFTNITSNIDVKGSTCDVGGLFGIAHYGNQFENCSCSGDVEIYAAEAEVAQEIGGIAGVWNNGGADVVFTNCTFTGTLKTDIAVDFYYGGLVGKPYSATGTGKLIIDGYEMVANGVGMKDGEYFVMSAQGLAWVEAQEDKYFAGKTIKLANDIDMTGVTIEKPIHFWNGRTTFDGQDYTISNLTMTTTSTEKKPFGLFGGTADIKNVKFDKANISGYSYVAVVAGNLYGNIENCHVSNSSVTCTYWMAGAMSGQYNAGNVTNCSVTNTTITGPAAVGALVGNINETAGERKVENCTVTDCTVAQNGSFGGDYDKMFGTAVGLVNISNSKVYINGCKVENTTVKGATSANIFGLNGGDNTTIYVDDYTYTPDGTIEDENGNLVVNSPESLEAALTTAGAAGAGDTTIVFAENSTLDMNGVEWEPIKVDGYHGADIVTIDGKGSVITGLTAPLFAGGFAGGSGIVIKDLTIKDSDIVSANTLGSGAFIESVDSMAKIELTNCHLLDSTVTGGAGSRTGGLIGWTAGYNNVNDGPVKTYVTIDNCSVIGCTIQCDGSVGGINGHAGNNAWTFTTISNCTITNNKLISTDDGEWRTGVVVGTANVGEVTISNITESGNTLTQTGKTAPEGYLRNYYGRFVPGSTGTLTIDGYKVVAEGKLEDAEGNTIATNVAGLKDALKEGEDVILADDMAIKSSESESNSYGKTGINMTNGGTIDGGGNDISINAWSTWDSAINTTGGTIKNINVTGGMRGIFVNHNSDNCSKVYLENVVVDGTVYTISCDQGTNNGLEATNSTFNGWTSYAATIGDVKFTNCYFGEGQGYSYCRPYAPTEFVGCDFEAGFILEPVAAVTLEDCTYDGVAVTAENLSTFVTNTANVTIK